MNKNYYWKLISIMFVTAFSFAFLACSGDDEVSQDSENDLTLLIDSEGQTEYDLSLVNTKEGAMSFMNINNEGFVDNIDILYNNGESMMNVTFYENGLVRSIGNENYAVMFSNYNDNKVDMAIICGDEVIMEKDYEGDLNWEDYIESFSTTRVKTRSNAIVNGFWTVEEFLYKFSKQKTVLGYAGNQAWDMVQIYRKANSPQKELIARLLDWGFDILAGGIDFLGNDSMGLKIKDMGEVAVEGALLGPLGALGALVSNYASYEDLCTELWLKFFEWKDKKYENNVNLGVSALNSGSGDLKVTLSWNFYADIDLYAQEPSGNIIYYGSKRSSSGGYLDVDNRNGGSGASENIYWENPKEGNYLIYLDYYGPSSKNYMSQSGICNVVIMYKGIGRQYNIWYKPDRYPLMNWISHCGMRFFGYPI